MMLGNILIAVKIALNVFGFLVLRQMLLTFAYDTLSTFYA